MKGIVFGFGRMGITQLAIFSQYAGTEIYWSIIEPSIISRIVGKLLFVGSPMKFLAKVPSMDTFDIALITSPVAAHGENFLLVQGKAKKIFIEKPLSVPSEFIKSETNVLPGYVLRHNSMLVTMKSIIGKYGLSSLSISVTANTAASGSGGWRFSRGSGVIEEFGSHIINLAIFLAGSDVDLVSSTYESVVTTVPDSFKAQLVCNTSNLMVSANWAVSSARKPTYVVEAALKNGYRAKTDLYELSICTADGEIITQQSLASSGESASFYLRGFEFSEQARVFFESEEFQVDLSDAIRTDELIEEILCGNNIRR